MNFAGKVLVMVADPEIRKILRNRLARSGVTTEQCETETACMACLKDPAAAMIIADLGTPPEALDAETLRANFLSANKNIRVVFLSDDPDLALQDCAVYCRDEVTSNPQGLLDGLLSRLGLTQLHERTRQMAETVTTLNTNFTTFAKTTHEVVSTLKTSVETTTLDTLWAKYTVGPIMKTLAGAAVAALLSLGAYARTRAGTAFEQASRVPRIESRQDELIMRVATTEARQLKLDADIRRDLRALLSIASTPASPKTGAVPADIGAPPRARSPFQAPR